MIKVLFVCIHNSARSQMAEAFLNHYGQGRFEAQSAGLEPGTLNPWVVESMREIGIDMSRHKTKSVSEILKTGQLFNYVITVCDETSAGRCPSFPGPAKRLHWNFPDPSQFSGSPHEKLIEIAKVRDAIHQAVVSWIKTV